MDGMHIAYIPDHFTQVNEKVKEDGGTWTRYDGFDGRYSVCITVCPSGYRYIQIFTHRDTPHPSANLYAPEMYVVEDDTTPVDVRLDLTSEAKRFVKEEAWEQIKAEVDMGLTAAKEIKRRFM